MISSSVEAARDFCAYVLALNDKVATVNKRINKILCAVIITLYYARVSVNKTSKRVKMVSSGDDDGLSDRDRQIWKQYIADEGDPVQDENFEELLNGHEAKLDNAFNNVDQMDIKSDKFLKQSNQAKHHSVDSFQIDKRTLEKLKKGKVPIEARLDLHGLTRTQAYEQLNNFLSSCYQRHLRCVLVITGKGKSQATSENWLTPSQGVLKTHVPLWLAEGYLRKIVLKFTSALPKDGGSGALYVYLKKNR